MTTTDAARKLGTTPGYVRVLVRRGLLKATLFGTQLNVSSASVRKLLSRREK
jgi:excisionase family DNA binding protein